MDWRIILLLIVFGIWTIVFLVMLFKLGKLEDEKLELQAKLAVNEGELKTAIEAIDRYKKLHEELEKLTNEELLNRLRINIDNWKPENILSGDNPG